MSEELKPCRKCGASAQGWGSSIMTMVYIECDSCGEHTEDFYGNTEQEAFDKAIAAWNRRA
jgi:hypothetical protein